MSDIHANSIVGLCAPHTKLQEGGEYALNQFQRWLWTKWKDFIKQVPKGSILLINGDWLHGHNGARETGLISTSATDMCRIGAGVIEPLADKAKSVYVIKGTSYHGGIGEQDTEAVAQDIGAVRDDGTGQYSHWSLFLQHEGLLFHFAHHISIAPVFPLSPMQRELTNAKINSVDAHSPCPDVLVRSHRHQYREYFNNGRWVFATAGWQLQTDYTLQKMPMALPDVGGLILWVKKRQLEHHPVLYPLPPQKILLTSNRS